MHWRVACLSPHDQQINFKNSIMKTALLIIGIFVFFVVIVIVLIVIAINAISKPMNILSDLMDETHEV